MQERCETISTGAFQIGANSALLGAPARVPSIWGGAAHTGTPYFFLRVETNSNKLNKDGDFHSNLGLLQI
jgi:hypothetical protein